MEGRSRATLINKVAGYKTANLIGTLSAIGVANLALFNSVVHIGANPPFLGFILRPATVPRHTYENLRETGCYTINQVTSAIHKQAHCSSGKFPPETSEFEACGLTPLYTEDFQDLYLPETAMASDGDVALEELDTVAIGGLDTYYRGVKLGRYGYYRPGEELKELG